MIRALLAAALMLWQIPLSAATSDGYLGVFGGAVAVDGMDTERADPYIFNLGYRLSPSLAFQLEYSEAAFSGSVTELETSAYDIEYRTQAAYLMWVKPLNSLFDLNLKYGYIDIDYDFLSRGDPHNHKQRFSSHGAAYGGGLTLKTSRTLVLTFDYTQLRDDARQLSAGVELNL